MSGISVGGLASGIDSSSIIAQLTSLEQAKVTREEAKKKSAETTLEKFSDLETRLGNLAKAAGAVDEAKDFNIFSTLSNNDEYAVVSGDENAVDGQYEIVVNQLATTQKVASSSFDNIATARNWTGEFEVSTSNAAQKADSTKTSVTIKVDANDSLKDIASKINSADGIGVRASLMSLANGENRLILTALDEGTEGFFLKGTTGDDILGSKLGILSSKQSAATDNAFVTLDGTAAQGTTKFMELSTGLTNNNLDDGDVIVFSGFSADNNINLDPTPPSNAISGSFTITPTSTINDFLTALRLAYNGSADPAVGNTDIQLNKSGEIILTSKNAGLTSAISLNMSLTEAGGGQTSTLALGGSSARNTYVNTLNEAQNAFYTLDGMAVSSQTNQDSSTITGTTFTLKKADPDVTVKVSLKQDNSAIADKIKAFVEEYSTLMKFIDENSKVTMKEETDDNGKKKTTRTKGAFSGDSNISSLRTQLQSMMTSPISELADRTQYSSLSRIGITTDRTGSLEVDSDKLTKALTNDLDGVRRLFTVNGFSDDPGYTMGRYTKDTETGTYYIDVANVNFGSNKDGSYSATDVGSLFGNIFTSSTGSSKGLSIEVPDSPSGATSFTFVRGVANQFSWFVDKAKDYVDGYFKSSKDTYQKRIDSMDERIDTLQTRVDNYEKRLTAQFTALELSMSKMQSQTSNMLSQLSSL